MLSANVDVIPSHIDLVAIEIELVGKEEIHAQESITECKR
jgi:hypothetical protein